MAFCLLLSYLNLTYAAECMVSLTNVKHRQMVGLIEVTCNFFIFHTRTEIAVS